MDISNITDIIKTRKSFRTFDGKLISKEHKEMLSSYIKTIDNPYNIPVEFIFLNAEEHGLSSPVIKGEHLYIAAKVPKTEHCEEAFGFSFEKMVLYAWSLGIGTTWIGGTMPREKFEKAVQLKDNELMLCVSPLGYPANKMSVKELAMRAAIKADKRSSEKELFFENNFSSPLNTSDEKVAKALETVRFAPSAVNKQPWRIVKTGNTYNFYEYSTLGGHSAAWDVQKVDMGIALCHFITLTSGELCLSDPHIETPKKHRIYCRCFALNNAYITQS
ncbi:MAG: nitroreductase family protein [Firmicutes bacterium]|nr:nitroreductase family protein [Bacillota bacterium]